FHSYVCTFSFYVLMSFFFSFFFFFQAEDGIRDFHVTGVQTCALPISSRGVGSPAREWTCWLQSCASWAMPSNCITQVGNSPGRTSLPCRRTCMTDRKSVV